MKCTVIIPISTELVNFHIYYNLQRKPFAFGGKVREKGVIVIDLKKFPKLLSFLCALICIGLLILSVVSVRWIPLQLYSETKEEIRLNAPIPLVATVNEKDSQNATVKLFGCIPISNANVQVQTPPQLVLGGQAFGIKIAAKGVIVVGMATVETPKGTKNPGKETGLSVGDVILAVNGSPISQNEQLAQIIAQTKGQPVTLSVERKGVAKTLQLQPVLSREGVYRVGIWVRDSTAGLGTVTFCDPNTGVYAGLGHGVCDSDTQALVPLSAGEVVGVQINGIRKSTPGKPGEVKGTLLSGASFGSVEMNCNCGIYGTLTSPLQGQTLPLGYKHQVKEGNALVYCTVNGTLTQYTCEIEKVLSNQDSYQNMVIRITDKALLSQTGGIVQGMSGSPIVQDGKLVGAITHVFVNEPTKGYGVFAQTMWETAQGNSQNQEVKKAS